MVSGPQLTAKVPIRAPGKSIAPVPSSWFQLAIGQFPPSFAANKFPTSSQQVQAVFHPVKHYTWLYLSLRLTKMDPNWSCTLDFWCRVAGTPPHCPHLDTGGMTQMTHWNCGTVAFPFAKPSKPKETIQTCFEPQCLQQLKHPSIEKAIAAQNLKI